MRKSTKIILGTIAGIMLLINIPLGYWYYLEQLYALNFYIPLFIMPFVILLLTPLTLLHIIRSDRKSLKVNLYIILWLGAINAPIMAYIALSDSGWFRLLMYIILAYYGPAAINILLTLAMMMLVNRSMVKTA